MSLGFIFKTLKNPPFWPIIVTCVGNLQTQLWTITNLFLRKSQVFMFLPRTARNLNLSSLLRRRTRTKQTKVILAYTQIRYMHFLICYSTSSCPDYEWKYIYRTSEPRKDNIFCQQTFST